MPRAQPGASLCGKGSCPQELSAHVPHTPFSSRRGTGRLAYAQEIVANAAKVQTALKLSQEDQNTIASLKREIEKAWKMVDAAHEKAHDWTLRVAGRDRAVLPTSPASEPRCALVAKHCIWQELTRRVQNSAAR